MIWCAAAPDVKTNPFASRMDTAQQFFEKYESYMPVRTTWLMWRAFARMSGDDVLALARARDRLLERLFQQGLVPEHDLPAFLRVAGIRGGDRFRAVRQRIVDMRDTVQKWARDSRQTSVSDTQPETQHYIDLIYAYGLARLGAPNEVHDLVESARRHIATPPLHNWLFRAFEHRINQALERKPATGQLPAELLDELAGMEPKRAITINHLRGRSRIIEPTEMIDQYVRYHGHHRDELDKELLELSETTDRHLLAERLGTMLKEQRPPEQRTRVVTKALELVPRLGQAVAERVLTYVAPLVKAGSNPTRRGVLLEKALIIAAHFDRRDEAVQFVDQLQQLFTSLSDAKLETFQSLESVLGVSMRGMRRFGMRDQMTRLLDVVDELLNHFRDKAQKKPGDAEDHETLKLLLHVAAGWFYFNQEDRAWPILNEVREVLLESKLAPALRASLACTYCTTLAQAPVEKALGQLEDLFLKLRDIDAEFSTKDYYSRTQLEIVDSFILAVASDDFSLDKSGRKWVDDDEFLIRRRVHADVRAAMELQ